MEHVIEICHLVKKYRGFSLKGVSFNVPRGTVMGLIGPNGAGKTTIIKLIMNLIRKHSGEIRAFGLDSVRYEEEIKARIGFVYDTPPFYDDIILKNIERAVAQFYPGWKEPRFESLAHEFQLPLGKKFKTLSHGMKMKFSLALALAHDADLLLMDEPTTGLDPMFRRELLDKLREMMQDEGKTILFSTHITSDLEKIADAVTFIQDGSIKFSASIDDIRDNWAVVKGGDELLRADACHLFLGMKRGAFGVQGLTADVASARRVFGDRLVTEKATLDEIMVFMHRGGDHDIS